MAFQYLYCGNWDFKGEMKGIHSFRFDPAFGKLLDNGVYGELCGQSMLAIANGYFLSVCELGSEGHVVCYAIGEDGSFAQRSVLDFSSPKLSYIKADSRGEYVFVPSMGDGSVRMIRILDDGSLECVYETFLTGQSVTPRAFP